MIWRESDRRDASDMTVLGNLGYKVKVTLIILLGIYM